MPAEFGRIARRKDEFQTATSPGVIMPHIRSSNAWMNAPDLTDYLRGIGGAALLTAEDEARLARAAAAGDREAQRRLASANLRLVVKIARGFQGRGLSLDDLIGEGNLGLIRAAEDFDPDFGVRFSTYAGHWIKQAIRHALLNTTATIRIPAHMTGLLTKWRRIEREVARREGRMPGFDEVADRLGLTDVQRVLAAKARRALAAKLESGVADDEGAWSPDDSIDPDAEGPSAGLEALEERAELARRMRDLDERERLVLTYRYGLDGATPLTLRALGERLGVTREWARKIELKALRKLDSAG